MCCCCKSFQIIISPPFLSLMKSATRKQQAATDRAETLLNGMTLDWMVSSCPLIACISLRSSSFSSLNSYFIVNHHQARLFFRSVQTRGNGTQFSFGPGLLHAKGSRQFLLSFHGVNHLEEKDSRSFNSCNERKKEAERTWQAMSVNSAAPPSTCVQAPDQIVAWAHRQVHTTERVGTRSAKSHPGSSCQQSNET